MPTAKKKERRPFHETILDAIRRMNDQYGLAIADLIKATKIPKGHDEIIAAWKQRVQELGYHPSFGFEVTDDLLEQKAEAEREKKEKALASALDESPAGE